MVFCIITGKGEKQGNELLSPNRKSLFVFTNTFKCSLIVFEEMPILLKCSKN